MKNLSLILLLVFMLGLTACDPFSPDGDEPAPAQVVMETAEPYIPNGIPRALFDLAQVAVAALIGRRAGIASQKKLAEYDESEFTVDEAESMKAAMDALEAERLKQAAIEKAMAELEAAK